MSPALPARGVEQPRHFSIDAEAFTADFDQRPFYLEHDLQKHALFELPAMAALSGRLPAHLVEWNSGHAGAYGKPDLIRPPTMPCSETILAVAEQPAWVLLRQIEHDPSYRTLVDELLDEIRPFSEPLRPGMYQREAFLFISSRAAVTPFHFDPEHNFLLQVRGRKTVHMWNAADRHVLSEQALDDFYANVSSNRNLRYQDDFLESAWILPLSAGQGVHFPLHAPHWVKTESDVSISLSITFRSRQSKFCAGIHNANGHVRRFGIEPPIPGTSRLWDNAAQLAYIADRRLRMGYGALRRAFGKDVTS